MLNKSIDYKLSKYQEKLAKVQNDEKKFSLYSKKVERYKSLYQNQNQNGGNEDIYTFDTNIPSDGSIMMTDTDETVRRYLNRKTLNILFGEDGNSGDLNYKSYKNYAEVEYLLKYADSAEDLKNQLDAVFNVNEKDDYNYKSVVKRLDDPEFAEFVRGFKVLDKLKNDSEAPSGTDIEDLIKLAEDIEYKELIKSMIANMKHKDEW